MYVNRCALHYGGQCAVASTESLTNTVIILYGVVMVEVPYLIHDYEMGFNEEFPS